MEVRLYDVTLLQICKASQRSNACRHSAAELESDETPATESN